MLSSSEHFAADRFPILLLEDETADAFFFERALKKYNPNFILNIVGDGEQGIAYLQGEGQYQDRERFPSPKTIILDLKMPRRGGLDFLEWVKENSKYRVIPTIVLTSSLLMEDVEKSYDLGANTYFVKPDNPNDLEKLVNQICDYWKRAMIPNPKRT